MDQKELRAAGNQNAYPVVKSGEFCEVTEWGITKREHFAAMMMPAFLAKFDGARSVVDAASEAVYAADELLRALAAGGEG